MSSAPCTQEVLDKCLWKGENYLEPRTSTHAVHVVMLVSYPASRKLTVHPKKHFPPTKHLPCPFTLTQISLTILLLYKGGSEVKSMCVD